jgi:hypothetical protein
MNDAPKVTDELIAARITDETYYVFPGTTVTVALLTMENGFNVVGHSACVSPVAFDAEIGRSVARDDAVNKLWSLEGYLLREKISRGEV